MTAAREQAQQRRQRTMAAETAYESFLSNIATPLARQVANALSAEGYAFTVSTPGRGIRLALDRGRDDFIEIALDTEGGQPVVVGRVRRTRGSRTIEEDRPIKPDASPDQLGEEDLLEFLVTALEPWLER
jgi:hypothetical protein